MKRMLLVMIIFGFTMSVSATLAAKASSGHGEFDKIFALTSVSDGVKKITYDQFIKIRNSGEEYVLIDVLSAGDYRTGHIEGAISMPMADVTEGLVRQKIPKGSRVIVYCNGFECHASSQVAKKISSYGYLTLDYKGGLEEWQAKGGKLVKK